MRKYFILIIMILALMTRSFSQNSLKKNSIYLELAGNGIIYSVNYDRIIPLSGQFKLAPRIGFEYFPQSTHSTYDGIILPLEMNILWAKRTESKNFAEAGLGLSLIGMKDYYGYYFDRNVYKNKFARVTTIRLGYRHQKSNGGFMYRAGLLVPIAQDKFSESRVGDDIFLRLYAGFSLGYSF